MGSSQSFWLLMLMDMRLLSAGQGVDRDHSVYDANF
jgi:hypothetical protein